MLLNIDVEGRGVVCRGICGNVRHGKTCISAASMEGVCVSAMLFQSAREVAGGLRGFLRWIGMIELTLALLNVDVRKRGIKFKLSNISEVFEAGTNV